MRRRHFQAFAPHCPTCAQAGAGRHPLVLAAAHDADADDVRSGILHCPNPACRHEYPIIDGIPLIVPALGALLADRGIELLLRQDLDPALESLIGDAIGPGTWFDTMRQTVSSYAWDSWADLDPAEARADDGVQPGAARRCLDRLLSLADGTRASASPPAPPPASPLAPGPSVPSLPSPSHDSARPLAPGPSVSSLPSPSHDSARPLAAGPSVPSLPSPSHDSAHPLAPGPPAPSPPSPAAPSIPAPPPPSPSSPAPVPPSIPPPVPAPAGAGAPRMLDLGCGAGRTSFDLAHRHADALVLGIDVNLALLRLAQQAAAGAVSYPRRRIGLVYDRRSFPVSLPGAERVDFWACDALALPFAPAVADLAVALNLLDCVGEPRRLLAGLAAVVRPGGRVLLATPYDWSTRATPMETWIGGHSQRAPHAGAAEPFLRALLTEGAHPQAVAGLRLLAEVAEWPWQTRLHDRSLVLYRTHLLALARLEDGRASATG